jgi:Uncharacterized conserved protein (DUF2190)
MAKAYKQVWKSITGVPAGDLSAKRYHFVKYDSNGKIVAAAAGEAAIGVLEEPNKADQPAQVVAQGFMYVELGGTVAAGAAVMADAAGKAVAHTVATAPANNHVLGILHVGGVAGDIGTVLLK